MHSGTAEAALAGRLEMAREARRLRRRRIQIPMLSICVVFMTLVCILGYLIRNTSIGHCHEYMRGPTRCLGIIMMVSLLGAVLPTDRRCIKAAFVMMCLITLLTIYDDVKEARGILRNLGPVALECAGAKRLTLLQAKILALKCVAIGAFKFTYLYIQALVRRVWRWQPRMLLQWVWVSMFRMLFVTGVIRALTLPIYAHLDSEEFAGSIITAVFEIAFSLLPRTMREHLQAWLANRGGGLPAAAGVAALLGSRTAEAVLELAAKTCRAVPLDKVSEADMKASTPNPDLRVHTQTAGFGQIDAFVSHSWHDCPDVKWVALQEWRAEFKQANANREPLVWIDKYCIDQNDIDNSLATLPVCLAGCRRLLVLAGATYQSRMWCVVELFTFLIMGGTRDRMVLKNMDASVDWANFDVGNATAFKEEDTNHLQNVIEAASGRKAFNASIQDLFTSLAKRSEV